MNKERINVMVKQISGKSALLLLYKDARYDMDILDKEYGKNNWQDEYHEVNGNLFCTIKIWDKEKEQWIAKSDVGVETFVEKEKGQASDAFKRAGYKWGIGRVLYSSPNIWVRLRDDEIKTNSKGTLYCSTSFYVSDLTIVNDRISAIQISDASGKTRYEWSDGQPLVADPITEDRETLLDIAIAKVKATKKYGPAWQDKVLGQIYTYDLATLRKLVNEVLKED